MKVCSLSQVKPNIKKLASVAVGISYVGPLGEIQGVFVLSQRSLSTPALSDTLFYSYCLLYVCISVVPHELLWTLNMHRCRWENKLSFLPEDDFFRNITSFFTSFIKHFTALFVHQDTALLDEKKIIKIWNVTIKTYEKKIHCVGRWRNKMIIQLFQNELYMM